MRNRPLSGKNFVFPAAFDELLWRGGIRTPEAARLLNRTQRTVRDWRSGARPVPRWAFRLVELTLLDRWEAWGVAPVLWAYPARLDLRFYLPGGAGNDPAGPLEPVPEAAQVAVPEADSPNEGAVCRGALRWTCLGKDKPIRAAALPSGFTLPVAGSGCLAARRAVRVLRSAPSARPAPPASPLAVRRTGPGSPGVPCGSRWTRLRRFAARALDAHPPSGCPIEARGRRPLLPGQTRPGSGLTACLRRWLAGGRSVGLAVARALATGATAGASGVMGPCAAPYPRDWRPA